MRKFRNRNLSKLRKILGIGWRPISVQAGTAAAITILEVVSLSLLVPLVVALILNRSVIIFGRELGLIDVSLIVVLAFVTKATQIPRLHRIQAHFAFYLSSELTSKLISWYYRSHDLRQDPQSEVTYIRLITTEANQFVFGFIVPSIYILSESLLLLTLAAIMINSDGGMGLFISVVMGSIYYGILKFLRSRMARVGKLREKLDHERVAIARDMLGNHNSIAVAGLFESFLESFKRKSRELADQQARFLVYLESPKVLVEIFAVVTIIIVLALYQLKFPPEAIMSKAALLVVIAFRAVTSIFRLQNQFLAISYNNVVVNRIIDIVDHNEQLSFHQLSSVRIYRDGTKCPAITIAPGQTWLIDGPSGSGKTLIAKSFAGLTNVSVETIRLSKEKNRAIYLGIQPEIFNASIYDNLTLFGLVSPSAQMIREILDRLSILDRLVSSRDKRADWLSDNALECTKGMSTGELQRFVIARCMLIPTDVIILDEALSVLQEPLQINLLGAIRELNPTAVIFLITHNESLKQIFTDVIRVGK